MGTARKVSGLDGAGKRVAIVSARFHEEIVERLWEGAVELLSGAGVDPSTVERVRVPGAWELPLALDWRARRRDVDLMVALGVVIRGGTPHFEYVCRACADGIQRVTLDHGVPIGFGVLTCDDREQALARAGGEEGNKGSEAAQAALEMAILGAESARRTGFDQSDAAGGTGRSGVTGTSP